MKIHLVTTTQSDQQFLVKSHTKSSAANFVAAKFKPQVSASVPSQEDLVAAIKAGVAIEDATNSPQAPVPEPRQSETSADYREQYT